MDIWCDDIKPNASGFGVDIFWTQKSKGVDASVSGTLFDTNILIFDYKTTLTAEVFEHVKKSSVDYVMQKKQEAKLQEEAMKQKEKEKKTLPSDVNVVSYV